MYDNVLCLYNSYSAYDYNPKILFVNTFLHYHFQYTISMKKAPEGAKRGGVILYYHVVFRRVLIDIFCIVQHNTLYH